MQFDPSRSPAGPCQEPRCHGSGVARPRSTSHQSPADRLAARDARAPVSSACPALMRGSRATQSARDSNGRRGTQADRRVGRVTRRSATLARAPWTSRVPSVVCHPGVDVVHVHLEEQLRHLLERRWSPRVHPRRQASRPREPNQISVVGVVVRMLMRQEDMTQTGQRHTRECQLACDSVPAIDHVCDGVADDDLSGRRARGPRPRAATRAEKNQCGVLT